MVRSSCSTDGYHMRCPYCHHDNDKVIDSRASGDGYAIRRRRECLHCQRRYTTYERLEEQTIQVVKKDGVREPFDADKLRTGISKACWKRPVSEDEIDGVIAEIQNEIFSNLEKEIDTEQLGDLVMQKLRLVDQVAYVRFASVYREFKDLQDFMQEMEPMLRDTSGDK